MNRPTFIFLIIIIALHSKLEAQESSSLIPDPYFETFEGDIYKMPLIEKKQGKGFSKRIQEYFSEDVFNYEKIGSTQLDKLNIQEQTTGSGQFPGTDRKVGFCMVLNSTVYIKQDGCYEFSLNSDDGSILWIDEQIIVDNDGGHQLKLKRDSLILDKGKYPVRVWYFQGMPDRFGLMMDSKYLGEPDVCNGKTITKQSYTFKNSLLFETNEYSLKPEAELALAPLVEKLNSNPQDSVYIYAYTDDSGSESYNISLSGKRANSVKSLLEKSIKSNINYVLFAKGESEPVASNDTKQGRAQNRRVEVRLVRK